MRVADSKMPPKKFEFNNNAINYIKSRNESMLSVSSASSCQSDSSEEVGCFSRRASTQDIILNSDNDTFFQDPNYKRCRSLSDGSAKKLQTEYPFVILPSLPESVLKKMGLRDNSTSDRLTEEELEQKFTSLALAFKIDAATVKDRYERQKRYRDQTESNLNVELDRLVERINRIKPLCIDFETTELLSNLLNQVDIVSKACFHATLSSERYGAVQLEERLTESVNLMVNHVSLLKQQRDSTRRQLQYTKRMLQDSNSAEKQPAQLKKNVPNGKQIGKRRASIASIIQQDPLKTLDIKQITRRTSDLSIRATSLNRSARPSRLELGVDLSKIKENIVENEVFEKPQTDSESEDNQEEEESDTNSSPENSQPIHIEPASNLTLKERLRHKIKFMYFSSERKYRTWSTDGTLHEVFSFCALMCFCFGLIILSNLFIEYEVAKCDKGSSISCWLWSGEPVDRIRDFATKRRP